MRYKVSGKCTSCSYGYCKGGFDKRMNKQFQECQEVGLRKANLVRTQQPLCVCLWSKPEEHDYPIQVTPEIQELLIKAK